MVIEHGEELTYAQLEARSNQLARHLRRLGVGPEVVVAICAERSVEMVVAVLAVLTGVDPGATVITSSPHKSLGAEG